MSAGSLKVMPAPGICAKPALRSALPVICGSLPPYARAMSSAVAFTLRSADMMLGLLE